MAAHEMLRGILDLFEECSPDGSSRIGIDQLRTGPYIICAYITDQSLELLQRVPGMNIDGILNLRTIPTDGKLSFIEFWDGMEQSLQIKSVDEEDDDLRCLKILRDRILRESRLIGGKNKLIPHDRLRVILKEVRESAKNKSTWDDAIESIASDQANHAAHSMDTISTAIKIMLVDLIHHDDVLFPKDVASPLQAPAPLFSSHIPNPIEEELRSQIDSLRSRLTESECLSSELMDTTKRQLKEISDLKDEIRKMKISEKDSKIALEKRIEFFESGGADNVKYETEVAQIKSSLSRTQTELSETRLELEKAKSEKINFNEKILQLTNQLKSESQKVISFTQRPDDNDKNILIESLKSQIQTLEVQKSDADAEVTRLKNMIVALTSVGGGLGIETPSIRSTTSFIDTSPFAPLTVGAPPTVAGKKTVSIYHQKMREDFVTTSATPSIIGATSSSRKSKRTSKGDIQNCVQQ